jgi:putative transposase
MRSPLDPSQRFHKPIRLQKHNYIGSRSYFVTICTADRIPYFRSPRLARWNLDVLGKTAAAHSFTLRAFCLMPEHLHLLAQGNSRTADLLSFIESFKHKTSFYFFEKTGKTLWQISFFDHILRTAEDLSETSEYILLNPVRAGLAKRPEDYPFCGVAPPTNHAAAKTPLA